MNLRLNERLAIPSSTAMQSSVQSGRGALMPFRIVSLAVFAVGVLLVGLLGPTGVQYGLLLSTVYAIAILGGNAVFGTIGGIGIGTTAYVAVGAYTTAYVVNHGHSVPLAILCAVVVSAVAGLVLSVGLVYLESIATALATFALAFAVVDFATWAKPVTGGDAGVYAFSEFSLLGLSFADQQSVLIISIIVMLATGIVSIILLNGHLGRIAITAGEAPVAGATYGINVRLVKLAVWAWSSALAGLAGALYAFAVGFVSPTQFQVSLALALLVGGLVGGVRSATGAWIGGLIAGGLPIWAQDVAPPQAFSLVFGLILLASLVVGVRGMAPAVEDVMVRLVARRAR
jgi:branched-chain amino acid transport system permease protein